MGQLLKLREAVVLAAGLGTRLKPISKLPKFAFKLAGNPLIHYPVLSLKSIGVKNFTFVVARGYEKLLLDTVSSLLKSSNFHVIPNPAPELGNGYSLLLTEGYTESVFYVSMCDHIYPRRTLEILSENYKPKLDVLIGGDSTPRYVDVKEATKIYCNKSGEVLKIDKNLKEYTYVDIGLFIMKTSIYKVKNYIREAGKIPLSSLLNTAIKVGLKIRVVDVKGNTWTDIDTPEDVKEVLGGAKSKVLEVFKNSLNPI